MYTLVKSHDSQLSRAHHYTHCIHHHLSINRTVEMIPRVPSHLRGPAQSISCLEKCRPYAYGPTYAYQAEQQNLHFDANLAEGVANKTKLPDCV